MDPRLDQKLMKHLSVMAALQSAGFEPVVTAIKNKCPFTAEALLMDLDADYCAHRNEYSTEEKLIISRSIDICWRKIDELKDAQEELKRLPDDGKHSVEDRMPEPGVQLMIYCAENDDSVGGGAAALGEDGKWYWTYDLKLHKECKYEVTHWRYL